MLANLDECKQAWGVFITAPHIGWHLTEAYTTRKGAEAGLRKMSAHYDGYGIFVVRLTFAKRHYAKGGER